MNCAAVPMEWVRVKIRKPKINLELLAELVSYEYGITVDDLKGSKKPRSFVLARATFSYIARNYFNLTLSAIGLELSKGHDTIVNQIYIASDLIDTNERFKYILNKCQNIISKLHHENFSLFL